MEHFTAKNFHGKSMLEPELKAIDDNVDFADEQQTFTADAETDTVEELKEVLADGE